MKKLENFAETLGKKAQAALQSKVSGNRARFKDDMFDLDLTYITPRLIAMGLPGEGVQGLVRNALEDVAAFFNTHHPGHFKIWNLSQRTYDYSKFDDRVLDFGFPDHQTAPLEHMTKIVQSIHQWLEEDPENVAAVHCLAGKGRSGCICCAYLVYSGEKPFPDEAMAFFLEKRKQGMESPCQKRYLDYLKRISAGPFAVKLPTANILRLRELCIRGIPKLDPRAVSLAIKQYDSETVDGATRTKSTLLYTTTDIASKMTCEGDVLRITLSTVVEGDLLFQLFHTGMTPEVTQRLGTTSAELARLNIHTSFVEDISTPLVFRKADLDVAFRQTKLSPDFCMELHFASLGEELWAGPAAATTTPATSSPNGGLAPTVPVVNAVSSSSNRDGTKVAASAPAELPEGAKECAVCFERPRVARLPCGHCTLCRACVEKVRKQFGKCPVCDASFTSWDDDDDTPDDTFVHRT